MCANTFDKDQPGESGLSRGRRTEGAVRLWLEWRGCTVLAEHVRTPFAEVDLVVRAPTGVIYLVEVKSSVHFLEQSFGRQKRRLARAQAYLADCYRKPVEVVLVCPSTRRGQIGSQSVADAFEVIPIF